MKKKGKVNSSLLYHSTVYVQIERYMVAVPNFMAREWGICFFLMVADMF